MHLVILGDGPLGRAVADAASARGDRATVHGRPAHGDGHPPHVFAAADVAANLHDALAAGCRSLIIAATGWTGDLERVDERLIASRAAAVSAPNFSLGAAMFGRLVEAAGALYGAVDAFEPFLVEWHRR